MDRGIALLLLLLLFAPLAFMPLDSAEPFKVPAEAVIVTLAWVFVLAVETGGAALGRRPFAVLRTSTCAKFVAALVLWLGASSLFAVLPSASWAYAGTVLAYIALGVAVVDWLSSGPAVRRAWVVGGLAGVVAIETVLAILQMRHFGFTQLGRPGTYFSGYMAVLGATAAQGTPIGTVGNPNYLAEGLALAWPVLVGWTLTLRRVAFRAAGGVGLLVVLGVLLLTSCRAAFLGLLIFAPIAALLFYGAAALDPRRWLATKQGRVATGTAAAVLVAGLAVAGGPLLRKLNAHTVSEIDLESRTMNWRAAMAIWREHPLNGAGLGGFKLLDVDKLRQIYPDGLTSMTSAARFFQAHNDPLQTLSELGLIGMLLIVLALGDWVEETRKNETLPASVRFGLLWGVGALLFASCFGFPFHIPLTGLLFALVIGLGLSRPVAVTLDDDQVVADRRVARALVTGVVIAAVGAVDIGRDVWPLFQAYHEQYLGSRAAEANRYDEADGLFRQAIRDNRFKATVITQALINLYHARRYQEMVDLCNANAGQGLGMDAMTMKGDALAELGRKDEAIAAYTAVTHYYSAEHPNHQRAANQLVKLGATR